MLSAEDIALAESEAQRWCSIALVAGFSPAARQQLIECGLCEELLETPTAVLLPLLGRMVAARTLAKQPAALALKPAEVPCERTLTLESRSRASQADASTSASDGGPTVRLIVARYQEDTSWLQSLPPLVEYHVLQKHALQPELEPARQTLLPNVGRESHSYLTYLVHLRRAMCSTLKPSETLESSETLEPSETLKPSEPSETSETSETSEPSGTLRSASRVSLASATNGPAATPASATADTAAEGPPPPLLVCTQGNPFEHNASFLDDVATLAAAARLTPCRLPRFTPLGVWSGGERLIYCDASGAPHQPKLLPIERTWRSLFGTERSLPLWFGFTPGALFAISRDALSRTPLSVLETALGPAGGLCSRVDPITGHVFERLWRYVFVAQQEWADPQQEERQSACNQRPSEANSMQSEWADPQQEESGRDDTSRRHSSQVKSSQDTTTCRGGTHSSRTDRAP